MLIQIAIGLAMGVAIFATALWAIRMLATPVPAGPDPDAVVETEQHYQCGICGLRLTVTHAQDADTEAPKHCREEMVPL